MQQFLDLIIQTIKEEECLIDEGILKGGFSQNENIKQGL